MKLQGLPILALTAVFTAGTAAATSIFVTLNAGAAENQSSAQTVSLPVAGSPALSEYRPASQAILTQPDGWFDVSADYQSTFGTNGLTFFAYGGWAPLADLRSLNASGTTFTSTSSFQEKLTGQIYIGTDPSPAPGAEPDAGAVPEPASWWLMAAAFPLILVSRFRRRRTRKE